MTNPVLIAILITQLWLIVQGLIKYVWDWKTKQSDNTADRLERLTTIVHEMKGQLDALSKMEHPDEEQIMRTLKPQIELLVLRTLRDKWPTE